MPSRQTFLVVDAAPPSLPPLLAFPPFASPPRSPSSRSHVFLVVGFGLGGGVAAVVAIFLLFLILCQRLRARKRHSSWTKVRRFSHRELKAATRSFSSDCKLGQGGFGAVYKGVLPDGQEIAVKRLDTNSLQGEREFQNELSVIGNVSSPHIVGLLGFCANGKKRLLVYEYMHNRSLQEALFDDEYPVSLDWGKRFNIIVDTAKALAFLHKCDPPIIHGDVKPSNVLLDWEFSARLADFGLARLKSDSEAVAGEGVEQPQHHRNRRRRRSAEKEKRQASNNEEPLPENVDEEKLAVRQSTSSKESPSIFTASPISTDVSSFVDKQVHEYQEQDKKVDYAREESATATEDSPAKEEESSALEPVEVREKHGEERPSSYATQEFGTFLELEAALSKDSQPDVCYDMLGVDSGKDLQFVGTKTKEKKRGSFGRDWWWRQESSGELSGKDYVLQWMEHDRKEEKLPASQECSLKEEQSTGEEVLSLDSWKEKRRDTSRSSEWWGSVSQEELSSEAQSEKRRKEKSKGGDGWHWWKDQECGNTQQLSKKNSQGQKKKADKGSWRSASLEWWRDDNSEDEESTRSKKSCKGDRENVNRCREWWKDDTLANSQEVKARKKKREQSLSREWWSGDLLSKGLNSTPSMRGTICYVAPEYGGNGVLSEKSDVYSFGVLLLVIISGRRPLQVMASPITQFERANLISWARHLAHTGNVLDLVDAALNGDYCRDQASLCITVSLLCLQRLPAARPSMAEVVKFLSGEAQAPPLPMEFSPSPPCRHRYKSRKHSLSSESVN